MDDCVLPDQIEIWPIDKLKPYAANARTHTEEQVAKVAASIAEFGWTTPVMVDAAGEIIAGHGRVLAAELLGLSEVPVIRLDHLTPAQVKAYRIADNRLAELAGWDNELLAAELHALNGMDFDLDLTGFDGSDLDRLLAPLDDDGGLDGDDDEVPEPPVNPASRPGDLWILGDHRLLCGDATSATDVARLLDLFPDPHLMVTDPPYGVSYDPAWRNEAGVSTTARTGTVRNDDRCDWRDAWALFPGDVAYVWHAGVHGQTVSESLQATGFAIRSQLIWAKSRFALSRGHYHNRFALEVKMQPLPRIFEHVLLMAADEDDDTFEHTLKLGLLPGMAKFVHVYHSRSDLVLDVSDLTKGNPDRLGEAGPRTMDAISDRVYAIDCASVDRTEAGHGNHQYYRLREEVIADVRQVLAGVPFDTIEGRVPTTRSRSFRIVPRDAR